MPTIDRLRYLRVSLLNACNLNCFYCRPQGKDKETRQTPAAPEKFQASVELLYRLGVRKVRFTGGEPTLYKHLDELIAFTKGLDSSIITAITTNGRLVERLSARLAAAGLDAANISLDTLDRDKFRAITSVDGLAQVRGGIEAAIRYIPKVKLNCVVIQGVNDDEIEALVSYADGQGVDIRFIEYMPTRFGRAENRGYVPNDETRKRLPHALTPIESDPSAAATYYSAPDLGIRVGFISPVSHPFCAGCDRIRLASDGSLRGCLFSSTGINLFELIDRGETATIEAIRQSVASKDYLGCTVASGDRNNLPSFVYMGG